jgi:hypothetical protein
MKNKRNLYIGIVVGLGLVYFWGGNKIAMAKGQKNLINDDEIGKKFDSSAQYYTIGNLKK